MVGSQVAKILIEIERNTSTLCVSSGFTCALLLRRIMQKLQSVCRRNQALLFKTHKRTKIHLNQGNCESNCFLNKFNFVSNTPKQRFDFLQLINIDFVAHLWWFVSMFCNTFSRIRFCSVFMLTILQRFFCWWACDSAFCQRFWRYFPEVFSEFRVSNFQHVYYLNSFGLNCKFLLNLTIVTTGFKLR